jgi:hypothetical protein
MAAGPTWDATAAASNIKVVVPSSEVDEDNLIPVPPLVKQLTITTTVILQEI